MVSRDDTVRRGDRVTIHMQVFVNGAEAASTRDEDGPEVLTVGNAEVVERLDLALVGRRVGDCFEVRVGAAEGCFGMRDPSLVQVLPRSDFGPQWSFAVDSLVEFTAPGGQTVAGRILEAGEDSVTVDFNHPLIGRDVAFDIEVIGIDRPKGDG